MDQDNSARPTHQRARVLFSNDDHGRQGEATSTRHRNLAAGMCFQAPEGIYAEVLSVLTPHLPSAAHARNDTKKTIDKEEKPQKNKENH